MKKNFNLTGEITRSYKTKASGAYVSAAAAVMMIVYAVASSGLDKSIFNSAIVIFAIVGILLFVALSAFTFTSKLGATMLMLFSFLSFCAFVKADGFHSIFRRLLPCKDFRFGCADGNFLCRAYSFLYLSFRRNVSSAE